MKHHQHAQTYKPEPVTHDKPTRDDVFAGIGFVLCLVLICLL